MSANSDNAYNDRSLDHDSGRGRDPGADPVDDNTSGVGSDRLRDSQNLAFNTGHAPVPARPPNALDNGNPLDTTDLDLDIGSAPFRSPRRGNAVDDNIFGSGQILDHHDNDTDNGKTHGNTTAAHRTDPWNSIDGDGFEIGSHRIPDNFSDASEDGFGQYAIPEQLSDGSDSLNAHDSFLDHRAFNNSLPFVDGNDVFADRNNNDDNEEDLWNRSMDDDDDALQRLLADRGNDQERNMNITNRSFFDEDAAYDGLLDDLIPANASTGGAESGEPRLLTEEELRRHLPEHQEIYRLATYFNEAIHADLPFDPEFDCGCEDHGIPVAHDGRKRRASDPLEEPPKKVCPRVPPLNWLTDDALPPRTCYLEMIPIERTSGETQAPSSSNSLPSVFASDDGFNRSEATVSRSATIPNMDRTASDDGDNDEDMITNSSSTYTLNTAKSASEVSLATARAVSPPPMPLALQMPAVAVPQAFIPVLPAAVLQPLFAQPQQTLETDLQDALDIIANRLDLIASAVFRRNPGTLDLVRRLQRNRSTVKRLQKELNEINNGRRTTKTRQDIENSYDKVHKRLRDLLSDIRRCT